MALQNAQYDQIMRDYNRRQLNNKHLLDDHRKKAYEEIPRLAEIDSEIAALSIKKAHSLLGGPSADWNLVEAIEVLSHERLTLLSIHGYPDDYLMMRYDCPICKDTGYITGTKCSCFQKAATELLYTQSKIKDLLTTHTFENFNLEYYDDDTISNETSLTPRETARQALGKIHQFIHTFSDNHDNLFLYGHTGVGKTFLSHCVAKELIDKGFCVIYFSAFDLFDQFAKGTFSNDADAVEQNELILNCDLLIIDDLGTEITNRFVGSSLFLCINERLMRGKSTIVSTNLSIEDFAETYSERILSRISSKYTMIKLIGKDIRIQKTYGGMQ